MIAPLFVSLLLAQVPPTTSYRVALLPVLVDSGPEITASAIFRLVSKQTQLRKTLRLISIDEFFFKDGGSQADGALACGSDTRCLARQLTPYRADLGLVVIVNGQLSPPLVGVLTLDTQQERLIAERYTQAPPDRLWSVLSKTVAEHLDQAGHPAWGRLDVLVEPPGATISLSPSFAPEIGRPYSFLVPPGSYRVRAFMEGHSDSEARAEVRGGTAHNVSLTLDEIDRWYESPWIWVGAAAVVAAAVTVTVVSLTPGETSTCGCVITSDQPMCPPCP